MPLTISEDYLSRPFTLSRVGGQSGRELVYNIHGGDPAGNPDEEEDVEALLVLTAPATYLGRILDSLSAEPQGNGVWKGYARYIQFENNNEYTFDTGGGTVKLTQSLSTINSYAAPGFTAPDFEGAIGVSEDRVEGVEVVSPTFQFSETHVFADGAVDTAYKLTLANLTGRVNSGTFRGFAAGEVLFLGAAGSKRGDEQWSITFRFACSPNQSGITLGSITGIDKAGWDYLWARYADFEDSAASALVKRAIAVYVERVYYPGDFSDLNIGT